ncbi:MAG TPA: DUF6351 family protein [Jiangellaceae bacterium]|nr:DUF6351 family protein [Jiangellaceae bacterium]
MMPTSLRPALLLPLSLVAALLVAAPAATGQETAADPTVQYPFACTAQDHGLELIVDNQDGEGVEVRGQDGELLGYSRDCNAETRIWYYAVDTAGNRHIIRGHDEGPIDDIAERMGEATLATTTLTDGREVPYLIRHERGVINRFIYSISMLTTVEEVTGGSPAEPDRSNWNGRLLYQFQGGVGIGHTQGRYAEGDAITGSPDRLGRGYAVVYSTGNRTGEHYNLLLGGRTAVMVKDHFVATHGEPVYTVGLGGSGGAIQQYVYAQNHPDLLDALVPQRSYPDMTTQTIHVGDCALLDRVMDLETDDAEFWADWDNRKLLQGLNSIEGYLGSNARGLNQAKQLLSQFGINLPQQTGSSECVEGWLGLLPLAMNPLYGSETNWNLLGDQVNQIERTHWDDVREVYGTDPETGFARVPWDNVGVQYGLRAVAAGEITPQQFLEVNEDVGSWKETPDMEPEGVPFESQQVVIGRIAAERGITPNEVLVGLATGVIPFTELFDPWSSRNARTSPDGGTTPAPRRSGDLDAIRGAYESGLVFRGKLAREIPIIDIRDYLEPVLDMHNSHQSFAARQRLIDAQGHHDGQVIWFLEADANGDAPAGEELTHEALDTIAQWMSNLTADPSLSVAEAAPAQGVDRCFDIDGDEIASGGGAWDGILDDGPAGDCTTRFEIHTTSRIEAGGPITGDIYKCHLMPVETAIVEDLYGAWDPLGDQVARLEAIFPEGVCDYDLPSVGDPAATVPSVPVVRVAGPVVIAHVEPGAVVELRSGGAVVDEAKANPAGVAVLTGVADGTYVLRQVVDGSPGLRTEPVNVG